jgi:methionine sulfoxide reductase heme-binding subunit
LCRRGAGDFVIWPWQERNRRFSALKAAMFALMFAPAIWIVVQVKTEQFGPVPLGGMTYWSGLWATALLLLALAVTPAARILGWRHLVVVRRMIGVTGLVYALAHIVIYFALRFWNVANIAHEMATRLSLILASIATIGLIALGVTSLDAAVARMGAAGWKRLHNTIYVITALALVHYLLSPDIYPEQFLLTGMFFWLMVWRALARRGLAADPAALAILAAASAVFAALFEAVWVWAIHGYGPLGTLRNDFTLDLGVPPAWELLALGLLIAAAAFVRQAFRRELKPLVN